MRSQQLSSFQINFCNQHSRKEIRLKCIGIIHIPFIQTCPRIVITVSDVCLKTAAATDKIQRQAVSSTLIVHLLAIRYFKRKNYNKKTFERLLYER